MDNIKIGKFIKQLRKDKNMTQKELADKLGVTDRAVSRWERGIGMPDISLLESLANSLNITVLELLKGEYLEEKNLNNQDLLETMKLSQNNTIDKLKKIYNYLAIIIVTIICIFIIITNIKSIYLLNKNYNMENYTNNQVNTNIIEEFNTKVNIIINTQGIYNDNDYSKIKSSMKIMKERLEEQNNYKYLGKKNYNYIELTQFYIDHQNLYTMEINNLDIYRILVKYDPNTSDNMIKYEFNDQSIKESFSHVYFTLESPYYINNNDYYKYINIDNILNLIYEREIRLCDDIIKVGDLK